MVDVELLIGKWKKINNYNYFLLKMLQAV